MFPLTNFHTHSCFCDGKESPEEYVRSAVALGFESLGFSAHAPLPFENAWSLTADKAMAYITEIERLKQEYADKLRILTGMEVDFIPAVSTQFRELKQQYRLDYLIGAVHLVQPSHTTDMWFIDGHYSKYDAGLKEIYKMDIRRGVSDYFHQLWEMLATQEFDVLAHADKIKMNNRGLYFSTADDWYLDFIRESAGLIATNGCIVEVNTRGIYKKRCPEFYPSLTMLRALREKNVPVTISTDAHHPSEIALLWCEAEALLREAGYGSLMVRDDHGWVERGLC